jgi:hypothetical protein
MSDYFDCVKFIETKNGKKFARQLGSAKKRDDGGFSVYLDALPPDGQFAIVPQRARPGAATKSPAEADAGMDDGIPF